ncbi:hypothetical protein HER10_EVM0004517 [Colletotrichum scovillei]|uniref:uncharacterized protein n=1 Tax=Colletotrichum scovillei TaxID=1209932 RepID=UPI0015C3E14C|nr:uncharacterized protein HER10_EVM0004517 [Colletotrichum scovillei]KAF4782943.1 hypothetical protein HER10_EVM0004517 [Colletotrichum scovillei]
MSAAIRYGPTSIAKIFIENQEDLEAEIYEGWTSLRHVFFCGGEVIGKVNTDNEKEEASRNIKEAVESHAECLTDILLSKGVNLNQPFNGGWGPLHHAIRYMHDDPSKIHRLLTRYPNPSDPNLADNGGTPLQLAIFNGEANIVKLLIQHGADTNQTYEDGSTPLNDAIKKGHRGIATILIESGASLTTRDADGHTALACAVLKNDKSTAWLLLSKGASVICPIENLPNLFCWCLAYNDLSLAWLLCQHDKVADAPDGQRMTPLHWASKDGHLEAVRFLLQQNATVDAQDHKGKTPLILATLMRKLTVMDILLENGASAELRDSQGMNALHHAARLGFQEGAEVLLRWRGNMNVNLIDSQGFNALHHAVVCHNADSELIHFLAVSGVNLNTQEQHGRTPLMLCAQLNRSQIALQLLVEGAKLGAKCPRGWGVWEYSKHYRSKDMKSLLESVDKNK